MITANRIQIILFAGFTIILLGYFMVWLPGPGVGLMILGVELNEWIKFLPAVINGQVGFRHWAALPPATLAGMLALSTTNWSNKRLGSWVVRGLAAVIALLALPPLELIRDEPAGQWLFLVGLTLAPFILIAAASIWQKSPDFLPSNTPSALVLLLSALGLALPTWLLRQLIPVVSELEGIPLGFGAGAWLNVVGHMLTGAAAILTIAAVDNEG